MTDQTDAFLTQAKQRAEAVGRWARSEQIGVMTGPDVAEVADSVLALLAVIDELTGFIEDAKAESVEWERTSQRLAQQIDILTARVRWLEAELDKSQAEAQDWQDEVIRYRRKE